ncbi:MAG: response regulator [Ktedonobacterales bacterium]|nr:response regulator [Ktedonobacterales bacterium]
MKSDPAPHVLVVDNDAMIRFVLKLQLEERGYHVATSANGKEAIHFLRTTPEPHVALVDVVMPEMDGFDVLDTVARDPQLRQRHAFALMTGAYPRVAARTDRLLARLCAPVLLKPYDMDDLYTIVSLLAARVNARPKSVA